MHEIPSLLGVTFGHGFPTRIGACGKHIVSAMKRTRLFLFVLAIAVSVSAEERAFDPELAKKLGADERGMKMYVLCILKTGPKDAEIQGDERKKIFAGHFENIGKLADEGKLAV